MPELVNPFEEKGCIATSNNASARPVLFTNVHVEGVRDQIPEIPLLPSYLNWEKNGALRKGTRVLGEGSFGTVVRLTVAHQAPKCATVHEKQLTREVGKKFALKTCPKRSPSRTPGKKKPLQRALLNEYQVFKQLEQVCQTELTPFIVKCFAMYQDENYVFTIMEYADAGELFDVVSRFGGLKEGLAKQYAASMINALEFLHGKGIAHRDVKLENILLDSRGPIKLTDFGGSKLFPKQSCDPGTPSPQDVVMRSSDSDSNSDSDSDSDKAASPETPGFLSRTGTKTGTFGYCAPEMFNHDEFDAFACDWWALGVAIFAMLEGYLPFEGRSGTKETIRNIQNFNIRRNRKASEEASSFIRLLLNFKPAQRMRNVRSLRNHEWMSGFDWSSIAC